MNLAILGIYPVFSPYRQRRAWSSPLRCRSWCSLRVPGSVGSGLAPVLGRVSCLSCRVDVFLVLWPHLRGVGFEQSDLEGLSLTLELIGSKVFLLPAPLESLSYSGLSPQAILPAQSSQISSLFHQRCKRRDPGSVHPSPACRSPRVERQTRVSCRASASFMGNA